MVNGKIKVLDVKMYSNVGNLFDLFKVVSSLRNGVILGIFKGWI